MMDYIIRHWFWTRGGHDTILAMASFITYTFGCRVNEAETESMTRTLVTQGFRVDHIHPDIVIINSCAVTAKAEREVRQTIYQIRKKFPTASIVVTGCAATRWIRDDEPIAGHIHLVPNEKKLDVTKIVCEFVKTDGITPNIESYSDKFSGSGRAMVKIQDGCHRFCSYCIVPYLRGKPVSKTIKEICGEIRGMDADISDVTLAAINTEAFGKDTGETLINLIEEVLETTTIPRLSFGSIHPWSITDEFLSYYKTLSQNQRFVRFFHIPIQSGCQTTLSRMNRQYDIGKLGTLMESLTTIAPDTFIGTDVIVGFPGETDGEFETTYEFLRQSRINRFHVFRYSSRPGTAAVGMEKTIGTISPGISRQRSERLLSLSRKKFSDFARSLIEKTGPALMLERKNTTHQEALLWNQMPIGITSENHIDAGTLQDVKVTSCTDGKLFGIRV